MGIDDDTLSSSAAMQTPLTVDFTTRRRKRDLTTYSAQEVASHNSRDSCWVTENGNVYNVTDFLDKHPGGADLMLPHAGRDVTKAMADSRTHKHSKGAYLVLKDYKIGVLQGDREFVECQTQQDIESEFHMAGWNEDTVDWSRGMVSQVHKFGDNYKKWVHSPVNRDLKLFDSSFIEFFSKTPWYVIPIVWIPVVLYSWVVSSIELHTNYTLHYFGDLDASQQYMYTALLAVIVFLLGIPLWTLVEYILHRHLFHLEPNTPWLITMHFFLHGQHHKVPFDGSRLVFPPLPAAVFALFFVSVMTYFAPYGVGRGMFAGGMLGYVVYDLMHYFLHFGQPKRDSYLHSLKYYHVLHHFDDFNTGYGISTKFWDRPFDTMSKKAK